jgi:uncharacterized protein with HEPN domain
MPYRSSLASLRHMLDHAEEALAIVKGKARADLDADRQFNLALVRLLEIVGEAANRVLEGDRENYKDIPWTDIIGLRNRLIHGYDSVDFDILWQIVTNDLPPLATVLRSILKQEEGA